MIHLTCAEDVVNAAGGHPYARFSTGMAADLGGLADGDAVLWWGETHFGRLGHAFGPRAAVRALLAAAAPGPVRRVNVLRLPEERSNEAWDFRWTATVPSPPPGQDKVVPVDDAEAINRLLDAGFPDTSVRPGDAIVLSWYGIWADGELIACGADRSTRPPGSTAPGTTGMIGAIAVHPAHRGRGLAAAVSAELTVRLINAHGLSCLGVMQGNAAATRVYERLGYAGTLPLIDLLTLE